MRSLGKDPWESIGNTASAQQELQEETSDILQDLSQQYGRENVVMALEGMTFDIRNRNILNTYDVSDEVFDELLSIKDEYDIEIHVEDMTPQEFARMATKGNPLMASTHQWPTIGDWETQWQNIKELRDQEGGIVFEVFFDLVIHTDAGYHERSRYVNALINEVAE